MKITLRIAAAVLTFLAGLAFRCWDHFTGVSGTRYVPTGHGWTGGPNVLQLTAFLWLLAGAVACLLLSLRDRLVLQLSQVRLVVDFETIAAAKPEYELRAFPGSGMGPGVELLIAAMRHYQQITGRQLSCDRVMAWHLRNALGIDPHVPPPIGLAARSKAS